MASTRLDRSLRITLLGLIANSFLAVGKFFAGWFGHSQALMADGVESFADVISSLVVFRGIQVAHAPADQEHPYGHGKAEPLAATLVCGFMFLAAVGIGYGALHGFMEKRATPAAYTLWILLAVILVKEVLFRWTLRQARFLDNHAMQADAWHHRSDAITSLAALLGISLAIWGGPSFVIADNLAALVAALIILWNAWRLLSLSMNELMDVAADPEVIQTIREIAQAVPAVSQVEKCIVRKTGYRFFVDMHIEVDPQMTVEKAHIVAHAVKDAVREGVPKVVDVLVHIEPHQAAD